MKRFLHAISLALLALCVTTVHAQTPPPFITQTVGTGSNVSYFVINFNDGANNSNSLASDYTFAYHWNPSTTPTGETMLQALNQLTNPTLQINQTYYASFGAYYVNGFTYLSHSQTGNFLSGAAAASWSYFVQDSGTWSQPQSYGVSGRTLFNGSYDGWTFHTGSGAAPTPVIAPEPASISVLTLGAGSIALLIGLRRRQSERIA